MVTHEFIYMHSIYTYILKTCICLCILITHTTQFKDFSSYGIRLQYSWLLFLFGQLNRLCLCVRCARIQYGISISYRYIHTYKHTNTCPFIWNHTYEECLRTSLSFAQSSYTCVFNLFALIIHNSINANKLTLSKMLYRFSLFLAFLCV